MKQLKYFDRSVQSHLKSWYVLLLLFLLLNHKFKVKPVMSFVKLYQKELIQHFLAVALCEAAAGSESDQTEGFLK